MPKKTNTSVRDADLYERYGKLDSKRTPKGKPLYGHSAILELLATQFYISEAHVGRILKRMASGPKQPEPANQLEIFTP